MKIIQEHSAGGVVYTIKNGNVVWLLGKHSGYDKWVLAKGRLEGAETSMQAALREVEEETGVIAKIVDENPVHIDKYSYKAIMRGSSDSPLVSGEPERRVMIYQEDPAFDPNDPDVTLVEKQVDFYLMEFVSGDPSEHDWEMTDAGWFSFEVALEKLSFVGEKNALEKAHQMIHSTR